MDNDGLRDWFIALTDSDKQIFLAFVSNQLTIDGRGVGLYLSGERQIQAFKGLNELQHQISGHIAGLGLGRDRYPDDVLWKILDEKATAYGIRAQLHKSLESARSAKVWNQ
jgi:hypothetical protein